MDLYNRGGFSEGYYKTKGNAGMMSTFRQNHFGTKGAKVLAVRKNLITARALEDLHKGDVLESATMNAEIPSGRDFSDESRPGYAVAPGEILHRTQNAASCRAFLPIRISDFIGKNSNGKLRISLENLLYSSLNYGEFSAEVSGRQQNRLRSRLTRKVSRSSPKDRKHRIYLRSAGNRAG